MLRCWFQSPLYDNDEGKASDQSEEPKVGLQLVQNQLNETQAFLQEMYPGYSYLWIRKRQREVSYSPGELINYTIEYGMMNLAI